MNLTDKQWAQIIKFVGSFEQTTTQLTNEAAAMVLMRICKEYATPTDYPLLSGEARDKWLIEKLQRFRIKFLERV